MQKLEIKPELTKDEIVPSYDNFPIKMAALLTISVMAMTMA